MNNSERLQQAAEEGGVGGVERESLAILAEMGIGASPLRELYRIRELYSPETPVNQYRQDLLKRAVEALNAAGGVLPPPERRAGDLPPMPWHEECQSYHHDKAPCHKCNPLAMRREFGFARTVCACGDCTINCRFIPGMLIPADLERIAAHVGVDDMLAFAADYLLASPGAIVGCSDTGQTKRIPTLVPARGADGACRFLKDGKCTIHEVSPFGCAFFDDHQASEESNRRSIEGLMAIDAEWQRPVGESLYATLWVMLNEAGLNAPGPMLARAQMKAAMAVAANAEGGK